MATRLLRRGVSSDADQLERFHRQARAVAQLNNPHVVAVVDAARNEALHRASADDQRHRAGVSAAFTGVAERATAKQI